MYWEISIEIIPLLLKSDWLLWLLYQDMILFSLSWIILSVLMISLSLIYSSKLYYCLLALSSLNISVWIYMKYHWLILYLTLLLDSLRREHKSNIASFATSIGSSLDIVSNARVHTLHSFILTCISYSLFLVMICSYLVGLTPSLVSDDYIYCSRIILSTVIK